jgi:hypothetical protein
MISKGTHGGCCANVRAGPVHTSQHQTSAHTLARVTAWTLMPRNGCRLHNTSHKVILHQGCRNRKQQEDSPVMSGCTHTMGRCWVCHCRQQSDTNNRQYAAQSTSDTACKID